MRIVSDGTSNGTHVYTDDGEEIKYVTRVDWFLGAGRVPCAIIQVKNVDVSLHVRDSFSEIREDSDLEDEHK